MQTQAPFARQPTSAYLPHNNQEGDSYSMNQGSLEISNPYGRFQPPSHNASNANLLQNASFSPYQNDPYSTYPNSANNIQPRGHVNFQSTNSRDLFQKNVQIDQASSEKAFVPNALPKTLSIEVIEKDVNQIKKAMKLNDTISAGFGLFGLFLAFIEEEVFFENGYKSDWRNHLLRTLILISSICLVVFVYLHYKHELQVLKARHIVYQSTTLVRSGLFPKFLFEATFCALHVPPGLDATIMNYQMGSKFEVSLNAYTAVLMLFRLYIVFRLFAHYTFWTGERASRVCRINGFKANSKFALRALLKERAFLLLGAGLISSIFVFGLGVRVFEKPYANDASTFKFTNLWNSFWCMIVTMTTIGYGDIFPGTHFGRLATICACIWGTFLLSLFVVALNNVTELTDGENTAFNELSKGQLIESKLSNDAYQLIQAALRLRRLKLHGNNMNMKDRFVVRMDMFNLASKYKYKRMGVVSEGKNISDILQEMQDDEEYGVEEVINQLAPVKDITASVETLVNQQNDLNTKIYELHEMSKKLFSLSMAMNQGGIGNIDSIRELKVEYNLEGERTIISNPQYMGSPVPSIMEHNNNRLRFGESYNDYDMSSPMGRRSGMDLSPLALNTETRF